MPESSPLPGDTIMLRTNIPNVVIRIFALFVGSVGIYLFIKVGHNPSYGLKSAAITELNPGDKIDYFAYLLALALFIFTVTAVWTLLGITKVVVNVADENITCVWLAGKKIFSLNDITEFSETLHKYGRKQWSGLLIKLKDNSQIQLAGQNLKSIPELAEFLHSKKIKCSGKRKMKFPFN